MSSTAEISDGPRRHFSSLVASVIEDQPVASIAISVVVTTG